MLNLNSRREFDSLSILVFFQAEKHGSLGQLEYAIRHDNPGCVLLPLQLHKNGFVEHIGFAYIPRQRAIENWGKKRLTRNVKDKALDCIRVEVEAYSQRLQEKKSCQTLPSISSQT